VAVPDQDDAEDDEPEGHELGRRDPEERPVAAPERLEHEPRRAVPDEEDAEQVAGHEPLRVAGEPEQRDRAEQPRQRFVQEQRLEERRVDREQEHG
jgi:hypothetical protein